MIDDSKKNYWYIVPKMIIDRTKYRGHGRPRKSDYRKFPGPQDFIKMDWNDFGIKLMPSSKGMIISKGSAA